MNAFQDITYTTADWVATVTIRRPGSYNAYTTRTLGELAHAFRTASEDDGVAIIVLTGRPQDSWLAAWSQADLAVPHPLDPIALTSAVATLARSGVPTA